MLVHRFEQTDQRAAALGGVRTGWQIEFKLTRERPVDAMAAVVVIGKKQGQAQERSQAASKAAFQCACCRRNLR